MKISIEIGGYGIRVATQYRKKIEMMEIGNSSSPYCIPSKVIVADNGIIHVGNSTWLNSQTQGKELYLDEIDYNEVDFERAYEALFHYIVQRIRTNYQTAVSEIVVIVPPSYATNDPRKSKIKSAISALGIRNVSFVSSDIAYCYHSVLISNEESVVVYNAGYNTTQISVVKRIGGQLVSLANKQIQGLGGRFFDSYIYQDIEQKAEIVYNDSCHLMQVEYMAELCRIIKEELSQTESVTIPLPYSSQQYTLKRAHFETMIKDDIESSIKEIFNCVNESKIPLSGIKKVILTGGSSRIPYIQKLLVLTFNVGNGEKKDILYPTCSTSAMWECCMGGLLIQNSGAILNL